MQRVVSYSVLARCFLRLFLAGAGLSVSATRPYTALTLWILAAIIIVDSQPLQTNNKDVLYKKKAKMAPPLYYDVVLDVVADIVLRTFGWIATIYSDDSQKSLWTIAAMAMVLEWSTAVSTYAHATWDYEDWKRARLHNDPWIVRYFFSNNLQNPLGWLGLFGLFSADLLCFIWAHCDTTMLFEKIPGLHLLLLISLLGRAVVALVELRLCYSSLKHFIKT